MRKKHDHTKTALVLQGGGALGAYQAGAYEALAEDGILPDWMAGISIGAVNTAIIAGNPPDHRVEKLQSFWRLITNELPQLVPNDIDTYSEQVTALAGTMVSMFAGAPHFFRPRMLPPFLQPPGSTEATSYYDTAELRKTLLDYVDFDLLNNGDTRVSLGAVNVTTGNFAFFDTTEMTIGPEHVMASGALPPGLPAIEIDGELFWDGGLVSNTPLSYVLTKSDCDTLVFQVDLFPACGEPPKTLLDVEERRKDIIYSSRTRMNTDAFRARHTMKTELQQLLDALPPDERAADRFANARRLARPQLMSIVQLVYRHQGWGGASKDFEFSRGSMQQHWTAGHADAMTTLANDEWRRPPSAEDAIAVYDLCDPGHQDRRKGSEKLDCYDC